MSWWHLLFGAENKTIKEVPVEIEKPKPVKETFIEADKWYWTNEIKNNALMDINIANRTEKTLIKIVTVNYGGYKFGQWGTPYNRYGEHEISSCAYLRIPTKEEIEDWGEYLQIIKLMNAGGEHRFINRRWEGGPVITYSPEIQIENYEWVKVYKNSKPLPTSFTLASPAEYEPYERALQCAIKKSFDAEQERLKKEREEQENYEKSFLAKFNCDNDEGFIPWGQEKSD